MQQTHKTNNNHHFCNRHQITYHHIEDRLLHFQTMNFNNIWTPYLSSIKNSKKTFIAESLESHLHLLNQNLSKKLIKRFKTSTLNKFFKSILKFLKKMQRKIDKNKFLFMSLLMKFKSHFSIKLLHDLMKYCLSFEQFKVSSV